MTAAEDARGLGFATATGHWVENFSAPDEGRREERAGAGAGGGRRESYLPVDSIASGNGSEPKESPAP